MKRLLTILVVVAATAGNAYASPGGGSPLVPRETASLAQATHALVEVDPGSAAGATLRRAGGEPVSPSLGIWRVPSTTAARILPPLALAGAVRDFEPDQPRAPLHHLEAADPLLPQQWWLFRVGADRAEPPGPGVPVTVIDSGLDFSHPEFAGRPNTHALNEQSLVTRNDFHGTAVASVVGAPANGVGIVGVYPQATLYSWDASPFGRTALVASEIIRGIDAASQLGRGVINLSFGGAARSRQEERAVIQAFERGSIVVAAAGNERERGNRPGFPASLPHVLTVGAVDETDRLAAFSSSSPGMDLVAPGTTIPTAIPLFLSAAGFLPLDGTSFAAPIVAGALAWVWTQRPELEKTQVFELIRRSARDLPPAGRNPDTGFGLLDIPRALTMPAPPIDPMEPNDELEQVIPGRMFPQGKPPLTRPGVGRNIVNARLDVTVDPRDIYRVWAPAGHRVVVRLTGPGTVELRFAGPTPIRNTSRLLPRQLEIVNRTRTGQFVYVTALIRPIAQPTHATYRLDLTTGRAPAPARR